VSNIKTAQLNSTKMPLLCMSKHIERARENEIDRELPEREGGKEKEGKERQGESDIKK